MHTDMPEAPWYVVEARRQAAGPAQHDRPPALHASRTRGAAAGAGRCRTGRRRRATSGRRGRCRPTCPTTPPLLPDGDAGRRRRRGRSGRGRPARPSPVACAGWGAWREFNGCRPAAAERELRACNAAPRFAREVAAGRPYPDAGRRGRRRPSGSALGLAWPEVERGAGRAPADRRARRRRLRRGGRLPPRAGRRRHRGRRGEGRAGRGQPRVRGRASGTSSSSAPPAGSRRRSSPSCAAGWARRRPRSGPRSPASWPRSPGCGWSGWWPGERAGLAARARRHGRWRGADR